MPCFYAPCHDFVTLQSQAHPADFVRWVNAPVNLDLVISYKASLESFDFGSTEADKATDLVLFPGVKLAFGTGHLVWLFDCAEVRDAELSALHRFTQRLHP